MDDGDKMVSAPLLQLQLVNLDRKSPLREQIYQLIRTLIIIGQLGPGRPVNEVEIAEQLGVSRTPVREAVKRLSDEGLINVYAQNGTFVAGISREALEEAYIIRNALELESVRRAAARIDARTFGGGLTTSSQLTNWRSPASVTSRLCASTTSSIARSPRLMVCRRSGGRSTSQRPRWTEAAISQFRSQAGAN